MKNIHSSLSTVLSLIITAFAFSCTITPEPEEVLVKSLKLSHTSLELTEGKQAPLEATVLPENATDKTIAWTSSKESVATVTSEGVVEAMSVGTAYITATNKASGKSARCEVKVASKVIHVTGIALDKTSLSMTEGEEQKLTVTITPENATDKSVVWKSGNEAVATVSEGVVKALRAGTATIQATTVDGNITANCNVSVDVAMGAVTLAASHITCRGADLAGKANLPQTAGTDLVFGILYSTSSGVLFGKSENLEATVFDSEYNFSCPTPVLEPETTYYYRSYISQKGEIMYGEVKSFTTLPVSSLIQTGEVAGIHPKEASLSATLDLTDCRYDAADYGFELAKKGEAFKKYYADNLLDKKYSRLFNNLIRDTEYTYRAYVKLDDRIYYGEESGFTTTSIVASITADATDVSYRTATIFGRLNVESDGSFRKSAALYYSTTASTIEQLKSKGTKISLILESDGSFSSKLTSLSSNTKYYFVVLSSVDDINQQTEVKVFTTQAIVSGITAEATDVKCKSAKISGKLTVESEGSFRKSATVYYSSTATTVSQLKSKGSRKAISLNDDGSYSVSLVSLASNSKYYYAVLSTVDDTDQHTEVKEFTTNTIIVSVISESSYLSYYTALISGRLDIDESEGPFKKSATLYYSPTETTVEQLKSKGTKKTLDLTSSFTFTIYSTRLEDLISDKKYYFVVVASVDDVEYYSLSSFETKSAPEGSVDLGLSVFWAECNIGADQPHEYGDYFAWGETKPKDVYSWETYKWCRVSGDVTTLTKYCTNSEYGTVDNRWKLELTDDVAHVKLGGNWRMPTIAELHELQNTDNCSWTWADNFNGTGVNGYVVRSKKTGYTDRFIFLPASGNRSWNKLYSKGESGSFWSSSLYPDNKKAIDIYFPTYVKISNFDRYKGLPVRPVTE